MVLFAAFVGAVLFAGTYFVGTAVVRQTNELKNELADKGKQTLKEVQSAVANVKRDFYIMGTFTAKVLAIFCFVSMFYVSKLMLSSLYGHHSDITNLKDSSVWLFNDDRHRGQQQTNRPGVMALVEEMALQFISILTMIAALLLTCQIFLKVFELTLPKYSISISISVLSIAALGVLASYIIIPVVKMFLI